MNNFSTYLQEKNFDLWKLANVDHPFVKGLGDGSLPLDKFQYYLKQDYIFLFYYCKVLALASSKSNTENIMSKWVSLLDETLNSEMNLHRNFCKEYGISEAELENTEKDSSTEKYCNFLLKNAEENSIEFIAVSLLPCQWGYQEIGQNLSKNPNLDPKSFNYKWIESYSSPEYQEVTNWLKNYVDEIGKDLNLVNKDIFNKLFQSGIKFEIEFWDSAWNFNNR